MSAPCPECHGKGIVVDWDDEEDVCPVCDGEGQLDRELQRQRF